MIVSDEGYGANELHRDRQSRSWWSPAPGPAAASWPPASRSSTTSTGAGVNAGLREVRDVPDLEPAAQAPGQRRLRGGHRGHPRLQPDRPLPPRGLRQDRRSTTTATSRSFPVLRRILERITGAASLYQSPTDMGVNRAGFGIVGRRGRARGARQEVIRRYFRYACEYAMGFADTETVRARRAAHGGAGRRRPTTARWCGRRARPPPTRRGRRARATRASSAARPSSCPTARIVTGKNSPLMHAASSLVLNAVKHLAGIPDEIHLLSPHDHRVHGALQAGHPAARASSAWTSRRRSSPWASAPRPTPRPRSRWRSSRSCAAARCT